MFRVVLCVAVVCFAVGAFAAPASAATAHSVPDAAEIDVISQLNSARNGQEALVAMDNIIRSLSHNKVNALDAMKLPGNFDGTQIPVRREETTLEAPMGPHREVRTMAVSALTPCAGAATSQVSDDTTASITMTYNYKLNPSLPSSAFDYATFLSGLLTTPPSMCVYFKVDAGALSLNADSSGTKALAPITITNPSGVTGDIKCDNCYAYLGMNLAYKMDCTINPTTPTKSTCTTQVQTGGDFNYGFDFSVSNLGLSAAQAKTTIYTGTKTKVFFDPQTQITIYATPTIDLGFTGSIQSTGTSRVTSSLKTSASLQTDVATGSSGVTISTAAGANVQMTPFTITSNAAATADFDFHLKFSPTIQWELICGQMSVSSGAATGGGLVIQLSNPYEFDFTFTKQGTKYSSGNQAKYGSTLTLIGFYMGALYSGAGASPLKYSKWVDTDPKIGNAQFARAYPIYDASSDPAAKEEPKAISSANNQEGTSFLSGGSGSSGGGGSSGAGGSSGGVSGGSGGSSVASSSSCGGGCAAGIVFGVLFFALFCFLGYDWFAYGPDGYGIGKIMKLWKEEKAIAPEDAAKSAPAPSV